MVKIDPSLCIRCGACVRNCPMGVLRLGETSAEPTPRRRCILCMHCAAGCPKKAVSFDEVSAEEVYLPQEEEPLRRLIRSRRSIRHFSDRLPDRALLQELLDTAVYAPSGKNQRAYGFTVVYGKEQVISLRDLCLGLCETYGEAPELPKLMKHGTDLLTCGAPCMIVAYSPDACLNPVLDPGVAMAQLELLLVREGLGTCWGGYLRQVSDRFPEVREFLRLPEEARVRCSLMVGYAKGERYPNAVWHAPAKITFLEDETSGAEN